MSYRVDERAVTVQIGAVLMLAILVSALALYQVSAVPDQNQETEFTHNERVTGELVELRDTIRNAGSERLERGVPITLGAQYQTRTVAINPPAPSGRLSTSEPRSVRIENATIEEGDPGGTIQGILEKPPTTRLLTYEPRYNEYGGPTTRIEHSLLYNDFGEANVTLEEQTMIDDDSVTLVFLEGNLSRSTTGTVSVDVETIDGPTGESEFKSNGSGNVTITLPTDSPERWKTAIGTTFAGSPQENAKIRPNGDRKNVTIELANETYDLQLAQVSVGDGSTPNGRFDDAREADDGSSAEEDGNGDAPFEVDWRADSITVKKDETRTLEVTVTDADENPIDGAMVYFSRQGNGSVSFVGETDDRTDETGVASVRGYGERAGETVVYASVAGTTARLPVTVVDDSAGDEPPSSTEPGTVTASDLVANQDGQTQTISFHVDDPLDAGDQVTIDLSDPHQMTGNSRQLDYSTEDGTVLSGSGSVVEFTTGPHNANVVYESNGDSTGSVISVNLSRIDVNDVANEDFEVVITGTDFEYTTTFAVKTDGDVTIPQDSTVDGNVYATGSIELEYQAVVGGTVRSDGNIVVGNSAEIGNNVFSGGSVQLEYEAVVDGTVHSGNGISLEDSAEINGDAFSGGSVELGYQSRISGAAVTSDEVVFHGDEVEINGSVNAGRDVTLSYQSIVRGDVETDGGVDLAQRSEITGNIYVSSGNDIQCGDSARINGQSCTAYVDEHY